MMYGVHPAIEGLHALRDSLGVIVRNRIPIGRDGRNRPSLFPFGTATGRNAQAKSLYNAHAGMRSFMKFPAGKIGLYLDWRTQEVGIAAARSGDAALAEDYLSGDIYHALAKLCGLTNDTDIKRWKNDQPGQRQRMKALQLGINYGMGVRSLSRGLDRHPLIGSEVIIRHQRKYPTFWEWRANMVERAMLERVIESEFDGWPLHLSTSPNKRTLYNFPMQSGGAEMLRLAANRLCEADLVPLMLVHDGILFELEQRGAGPARHRDHADCRHRGLRRPGDRRGRRSEADWWRALPGQTSRGEEDVGDRDGRAAGAGRAAESGGVTVLDKTKSYKVASGKLVERTAEELARLEQRKAEQAEREAKPKRAARMPPTRERFVITTVSQAERLIGLGHVCWPLFTILLFENFRQRGQPFSLPTR